MSVCTQLYIAAAGMLTPVGENAKTSVAAVAAGISRYQVSDYYNKNLDAMKLALVPEDALPALNKKIDSTFGITARQKRLLQLATNPIVQIIDRFPTLENVALFLAGPEAIPDCAAPLGSDIFEKLNTQLEMDLFLPQSKVINSGRAGGIEVIDMAFQYLKKSGEQFVMVGGVDTYKDPYLLGTLDRDDRVLARNIGDGFVPAEGAGFLLLVSDKIVHKLDSEPLTALYKPGLGKESGHRYSTEAYQGEGLDTAFKLAIENAQGRQVKSIYASLNGENFGAKELAVASMRNAPAVNADTQVHHPADCFGDIGAAFAPVMLALAASQNEKASLIYCSSENESRAAIYCA